MIEYSHLQKEVAVRVMDSSLAGVQCVGRCLSCGSVSQTHTVALEVAEPRHRFAT